jgi:hypothetical protein
LPEALDVALGLIPGRCIDHTGLELIQGHLLRRPAYWCRVSQRLIASERARPAEPKGSPRFVLRCNITRALQVVVHAIRMPDMTSRRSIARLAKTRSPQAPAKTGLAAVAASHPYLAGAAVSGGAEPFVYLAVTTAASGFHMRIFGNETARP